MRSQLQNKPLIYFVQFYHYDDVWFHVTSRAYRVFQVFGELALLGVWIEA